MRFSTFYLLSHLLMNEPPPSPSHHCTLTQMYHNTKTKNIQHSIVRREMIEVIKLLSGRALYLRVLRTLLGSILHLTFLVLSFLSLKRPLSTRMTMTMTTTMTMTMTRVVLVLVLVLVIRNKMQVL